MTYVVPFMNGKGGTGKSTLARCYAVEAARAGASVLLADLDDEQKTSALWAENRRRNGWQPEIRVEIASARKAFDLVGQTDVLVLDAPGWADAQTLFVAKWATYTVVPSRANRSDDLAATVSLLHKLTAEAVPAWRFGVALNGCARRRRSRMTRTPAPIWARRAIARCRASSAISRPTKSPCWKATRSRKPTGPI